jgi:iron complex transport system substrate-binding protein
VTDLDVVMDDDVTRREFLVGAAAATLLAACGGDDDGDDGGGAATSTIKVSHKYGMTAVPENPERIVTVGPTDEDAVLALGFQPVGITDWWGNFATGDFWPWAKPLLDRSSSHEIIPLDGEMHFEQIAAMEPDLIIGQYYGMTREQYDSFSRIAPTVAQSADHEDWQTPWQVMATTIGKTLGRDAAIEQLIEDVDARFAARAAANPAFAGTTVLYVERGEGVFTVRGANEPRVKVLTNLGLVVPDEYANPGPLGVEFSDEQMADVLDAVDLVVWVTDAPTEAALRAHPVHQTLRVAQEDRVVYVVDEVVVAAINWSTVLSLPYAADHVAEQIAAVVR